MRRLFALILVITLWFGFIPTAPANAYNLTLCRDNPAFQQRAKTSISATANTRFAAYGDLLCGEDGLPHLIVDGNLAHAGEFTIPGILFLYIAGWIGWVGRAYLIAVRKRGNPEQNEIIIDIPLAIQCVFQGPLWPLLAIKELTTGELTAKDTEIPISPR